MSGAVEVYQVLSDAYPAWVSAGDLRRRFGDRYNAPCGTLVARGDAIRRVSSLGPRQGARHSYEYQAVIS